MRIAFHDIAKQPTIRRVQACGHHETDKSDGEHKVEGGKDPGAQRGAKGFPSLGTIGHVEAGRAGFSSHAYGVGHAGGGRQ